MSLPSPALPALAPDLEAGLRRLKLARMRALAPEVLHTAKTQRWTPEEVVRTLVEAEVAVRDAANAQARLRQAHFPVGKTLEEFQLALSAVPPATFAYLSSLEWVRAAENLCLVGPSGTGKSHLLLALGASAVAAGQRVRYFNAASLVEALYRGLADNSVGRLIDQMLRHDLLLIDEIGFAPLDPVGTQLLFRLVAAAYERRSLAIASHARSHLAPTLRAFVDEIAAGLRQLGGDRLDIDDRVPEWFIAGHRKEPTGRPPGRPKGAKDSSKRAPYRKKDTPLPLAA